MNDEELIKQYGFDPNNQDIINEGFSGMDTSHPVIIAFAMTMEALTQAFIEAVEMQKCVPESISFKEPQTLFDKIVIDMFAQSFATVPGAPLIEISENTRY